MPPPPGCGPHRRALAWPGNRGGNPASCLPPGKAGELAAKKVRRSAMTKLLITEITRMGPAFCVIGLKREKEKIQSIRPVPVSANSWTHFPFHRGDILECALAPFSGAKPHIEDRVFNTRLREIVHGSGG